MSSSSARPETPEYIEQLIRLTESDSSAFIGLRHSLINDVIERYDSDAGQLHTLQGAIDYRLASTLSPRKTQDLLLELLTARIKELQELTGQLMRA